MPRARLTACSAVISRMLPPGPRRPRRQTAAWITRPGPFMVARPGASRRRVHDADRRRAAVGHARPPATRSRRCSPATRRCSTRARRTSSCGRSSASASVLLLDGAEHLRQRKLMLPPFHGERMRGYERARCARSPPRDVARWPRGERVRARPRMQAITLDVDPARHLRRRASPTRARRLRALLRRCSTRFSAAAMLAMPAIGRAARRARASFQRGSAPVDALLYEQIAERRRRRPATTSSRCCCRPPRGRRADERPRAARRAGHAAGRRPRDDRDGAALDASSGWSARRAAGTRLRRGGEAYAEAAAKEALRLRPVLPVVLRSLQAPVTIAGLDLAAGTIVAPSIYLVHRRAELYPDPAAFRPERFLGRPAGRHLHVDPVRRRRAPLPRRRLRADGAARRARRARRADRGRRRAPGSGKAPEDARSR